MTSTATTASEWSRCLVDTLVANGSLDPESGAEALAQARTAETPVALLLEREGLVPAKDCLSWLAALSGLAIVDLSVDVPEPAARERVDENLGRRHGCVGLHLRGDELTLACSEPLAAEQLREIAAATGCSVTACLLADAAAITSLIGRDTTSALPEAEALQLPCGPNSERPEEEPAAQIPQAAARRATVLGEAPSLNELLAFASEQRASDLHLAFDFPPALRIDGAIRPVEGLAPLDDETIRGLVFSILPQSARERFEATRELDTSHAVHDVGRFRVSVFQQRGHVGAVLRTIPNEIPELASLGLPPVLEGLGDLRRGLVLVTGPTGSGKSTTLASLVDLINRAKPLHIMTVEDPIEFVHQSRRSIVNQREVGTDTNSFAESLRHVLRQDPDVILVGEMRDLETIATALTAAETGHLVFATLHTQDAPQTLDRIIDVFPTTQQEQVRVQLASALAAVVTQQLLLSASGSGRVPVAEVMLCTAAIRNLIRTGKTHQLYSLMQTGGQLGMQTMDQALARAVVAGTVTRDMAFDRCHDANELADYLAAST